MHTFVIKPAFGVPTLIYKAWSRISSTYICHSYHRSSEHNKGTKGVYLPLQSPFRHYPFQNLSPGYGFFGATSKSEYSFRGGSPHVHVAERLDKKCIASSRRDGWNCGRIPQRCCSWIAPPALARWAAICGTSPGSSAKKFGGGTWDANKLAEVLVWKVMSMATWFLFSNVPNFFGDLKKITCFIRWSWCQFWGAHVASRCICFLHWIDAAARWQCRIYNMPSMWSSSGNMLSSLLLFDTFCPY